MFHICLKLIRSQKWLSKKIAVAILLVTGLSLPGFAETKVQPEVVDGDAVTIECITKAEVDKMSDEDKAKLILSVCEQIEKNADGTTATQ